MWLIFAICSAVFAGLTSILAKCGLQEVDSTVATAFRTVVAMVFAWIIVLISGSYAQIDSIDADTWIFLILSGLATGASWMFFFGALQMGPASVIIPIDKLSILVTIAFSYIVFREKLTKKSAIGLAGVVAGTLLLLL